jgi:hypothetical protein
MLSWAYLISPLKSRKVRVALAAAIAAWVAEYGWHVSDTVIYGIVGVASALILGIGIEDAGAKIAQPPAADDRRVEDPPQTKTLLIRPENKN